MGIETGSNQPIRPESFGSQFRVLRRRLGLSQREMGGWLSMSARDISQLERDVIRPPREPEFYSDLLKIKVVREVRE